jgi:hypothetical protein
MDATAATPEPGVSAGFGCKIQRRAAETSSENKTINLLAGAYACELARHAVARPAPRKMRLMVNVIFQGADEESC